MYRPADVDNIKDFGQYYRQSWIGYYDKEHPGVVVPFYVHRSAGEDPKNVFGQKLTKTAGTIGLPGDYKSTEVHILFGDILKNCQFGMPQFGSVIAGHTASYNYRDSPREGYRGYRAERLQHHKFGLWFYSANDIRQGDYDNWDEVWYTFNPYYYDAGAAFSLVESGERLACPISRYLTVHADGQTVTPALSYKTEMIGAFTTDGTSIVLSKEFKDYLPVVREITKLQVTHE